MAQRRIELQISSSIVRISTRDDTQVSDPTSAVLWNNVSVNWEAWTLGWGN